MRESRSKSPGHRDRDRYPQRRGQDREPRERDSRYGHRGTYRGTYSDSNRDSNRHGNRATADDRTYTSQDRERERRAQREGYDERHLPQTSPTQKPPPQPNFAPSGLLAAETNTHYISPTRARALGKPELASKGVLLKYNEPPEARRPVEGWRVYVFKQGVEVEMIQINKQSAYLVGRDQIVADIPITHPSASKQHAVIQFRAVQDKSGAGGAAGGGRGRVKPFVIDLDSTNGTFVNDEQIPASRYYELRENDIMKFAQSSREYVLLNEGSAGGK